MDTVTSRDFNPQYIRILPLLTGGYFVLFRFVSPAIMTRLVPCYSTLERNTRLEWDDRVLSSVNSIITFVLGVYALLYGAGMSPLYLWTENAAASLSTTLVTAYMLADTIVLFGYMSASLTDRIVYGLHHAVALLGGIVMPGYGVLLYLAMIRMLAEGSTPFVNLRWFFDKARCSRNNPIVLGNGIVMFLTFLGFRILPMPYFWRSVYAVSGTQSARNLPYMWPVMVACVVWDTLNCFWFYKITKGVMKALVTSVGKSDRKSKDT